MTKKNSQTRYWFPYTGGGEEIGFNDPTTTTFKGHIAYHLARESLQNSLDEGLEGNDNPVKVEFDLLNINGKELPNSDQFARILRSCKERGKREGKECERFYREAANKIEENEQIPILRIGDYNTKGLTGRDNEIEGNYFGLMKSTGSSTKSSGSGGSYGLGKGSYFAASSFRSIFVSSIFGEDQFVFQGKLKLVSHEDKDGQTTQGTGYYGLVEDQKSSIEQRPIRDRDLIPSLFEREKFARKKQGTDIFIVGYGEPNEWKKYLIESTLGWFWPAIHWGELEVKVGEVKINSDNLGDLMEEYFDEDEKDRKKSPNPLPYYRAYVDADFSNVKVFEKDLPHLGEVKLHTKLKDVYPNKVAYIRDTGMVIQKIGHRSIKGYAGVFYCPEDEQTREEGGNEILRQMENPAHDKWDPEYVDNSELKKKARKAEREMKKFVRSSLKSLYGDENESSLPIPGLDEFLDGVDLMSSSEQGSNSGAETNEKSEEETAKREIEEEEINPDVEETRRISTGRKRDGKDGDGDETISSEGNGNNGNNKASDTGKKDNSGDELRELDNVDYASYVAYEGNKIYHVIELMGPSGVNCRLNIVAGTEADFEDLKIKEAVTIEGEKEPLLENGFIKNIKLNSEGRAKLKIRFDANERYSLKVTIYEN